MIHNGFFLQKYQKELKLLVLFPGSAPSFQSFLYLHTHHDGIGGIVARLNSGIQIGTQV